MSDEEEELKLYLEIKVSDGKYNVQSKIYDDCNNQDVSMMLMALEETKHSLIHRRLEEVKM